MPEEWLTTQEAAELSGYHENYLRRVIRSGKVKARKFGPLWQVNRQSLIEYLKAAEQSTDGRRGPRD